MTLIGSVQTTTSVVVMIFLVQNFPIGRGIAKVDYIHGFSALHSGLMWHQSRNVPPGNLPNIGGREFSGGVCPAEIINQEVMGAVMDTRKFFWEPINRLDWSCFIVSGAFGDLLNGIIVICTNGFVDGFGLQNFLQWQYRISGQIPLPAPALSRKPRLFLRQDAL